MLKTEKQKNEDELRWTKMMIWRPSMNYQNWKRGDGEEGGGSIIKIFWSIELNHLSI